MSQVQTPETWKTVTLDGAADVVMGQSPPGTSYNEGGEGEPFFQGKAEFGELHPTVRKWTTAGTKRALVGDILMSVRAPVGPTNIANIGCVIGRGLAAIRARSEINQTYLLWILRSLEQEIASKGTGTTFDAISGDSLRGTIVPIPPIREQERIVEILEEQFSRLDAALVSIRTVREKAKAFRRSLLQAAFSGELSEDGTAAWEIRKFSKVAHVDSNLTDPKACGDLPHIAPNHIEAGTGRLLEYTTVKADGVTSAKHLFHPGHILYSKIRPYLNKVALVDFDGLCSADMYPISTSQDAKWLFYIMLSPEFVRLVSGTQNRTVLPKTNVRDLSAITIPVPPISVQHRIVEVLEEQFSRLDAALLVTNQLEARIASERRSLLHAAFSGTLTAQWRETQHG